VDGNVGNQVNEDRLEFLAQITSWYYEDNLSQEEIARRIGKSPSMISRLLQEARESNLLEIRVRFPLKRNALLEQRLCQAYHLRDAWVLANPPEDHQTCLYRVGKLGANCLEQHLRHGIRIGIGWGTAVYEVVRAVRPVELRDATVVQIVGSVGSGDPTVDGTQMARWLADKIGAATFHMHAPIVVSSEPLAESLRREPGIAEALRRSQDIDLALIGVGTTDVSASGLLRAGYVTANEIMSIRDAHAVGDVIGYHLDIHGNPVDISFNRRVIGLTLEHLRQVPTSIVVTSGATKVAPTIAVLQGGYANILVTDANTAAAVLSQDLRTPDSQNKQIRSQ
jgi:DNA-binding transcriptional regulator LsrR (DeoR family)